MLETEELTIGEVGYSRLHCSDRRTQLPQGVLSSHYKARSAAISSWYCYIVTNAVPARLFA